MVHLLVLANAEAGGTETSAVDAAVTVLRNGADVEVVGTASPRQCREALARRDGRRVVVCGGDGSVHLVVGALHDAGDLADPIGLVPLGTGNDLARAVGVPLDPTAAAAVVLTGRPRDLDLIVDDTDAAAVNAVHVGIGAEAARAASALKPRFGRVGYLLGGLAAGLRERGWRLRVETDGVVLADGSRPVLQVGIGNGTSIGGGSLLIPHAVPDDGLAHVVVSTAVGPLARLAYGRQMPSGDHIRRRDVRTAVGRTVTVSGEPFRYNVDGEVQGPASRRMWTVSARAWRLLVPAGPG
jgi:diacylglycerol kinase family enzyme